MFDYNTGKHTATFKRAFYPGELNAHLLSLYICTNQPAFWVAPDDTRQNLPAAPDALPAGLVGAGCSFAGTALHCLQSHF